MLSFASSLSRDCRGFAVFVTEKYEYKKYWYDSFIKKIRKTLEKNKNIIIGGDFNVIPEEIDVYNYKKYENDALFKLEIRKKYRELIITRDRRVLCLRKTGRFWVYYYMRHGR